MAVTGLEYQNRVFKVNALAQVDSNIKEFEVISKFIELLKSTPEFREGLYEVRFDQSLRKMIEEQDVLVFSVECLTADPERKKTATKTIARDTKSGVNF
jgi:hypothetical protein